MWRTEPIDSIQFADDVTWRVPSIAGRVLYLHDRAKTCELAQHRCGTGDRLRPGCARKTSRDVFRASQNGERCARPEAGRACFDEHPGGGGIADTACRLHAGLIANGLAQQRDGFSRHASKAKARGRLDETRSRLEGELASLSDWFGSKQCRFEDDLDQPSPRGRDDRRAELSEFRNKRRKHATPMLLGKPISIGEVDDFFHAFGNCRSRQFILTRGRALSRRSSIGLDKVFHVEGIIHDAKVAVPSYVPN
jgi:hypothetical protein